MTDETSTTPEKVLKIKPELKSESERRPFKKHPFQFNAVKGKLKEWDVYDRNSLLYLCTIRGIQVAEHKRDSVTGTQQGKHARRHVYQIVQGIAVGEYHTVRFRLAERAYTAFKSYPSQDEKDVLTWANNTMSDEQQIDAKFFELQASEADEEQPNSTD